LDALFLLSIGLFAIAVTGSALILWRSRDLRMALCGCGLLWVFMGQAVLGITLARIAQGVEQTWLHFWIATTLLAAGVGVAVLYLLGGLTRGAIAGRQSAEQALHESNRRFTLMADAAPVLIWITDSENRGVYFNKAWLTFRGRSAAEECRDGCVSAIHPEERASAIEACHLATRNRQPFSLEFRLLRHDGEYRWVLVHGVPMFLTDGSFVGCIASGVDISERKRSETRQKLMMTELDHRVKNNLAAVMALAEQTLRSSDTLEAFRDVFIGRLHALAHTHEALAHNRWEGIRLDEAARLTLGAYRRDNPSRVRIDGEPVVLPPRAALPLSLALHELATNAVKYGALSAPDGRIEVTWRRVNGAAHVLWVESGGPAVHAPEQIGTGISLIRGLVRFELGGQVDLEYPPSGLVCRMQLPLAQLTEADET
jgi:PAS domain S-box-containing protein